MGVYGYASMLLYLYGAVFFILDNISMYKVKALSQSIFSSYQQEPVPIDRWLKKTGNGRALFVENRGVLMYRCGDLTTHIWLCGVVQSCRRRGVMRAMLRSMLSDKECLDVISAHVNRAKFPEMVRFMESLGFQCIGPIPLSANGTRKNLERFEISTSNLRSKLQP